MESWLGSWDLEDGNRRKRPMDEWQQSSVADGDGMTIHPPNKQHKTNSVTTLSPLISSSSSIHPPPSISTVNSIPRASSSSPSHHRRWLFPRPRPRPRPLASPVCELSPSQRVLMTDN